MNYTVPSLMYGTQLSEDGLPHCNVRGYDCIQFYNEWTFPMVALEVAVPYWANCGVIYVDKGIPYDDGELSSAELTIEVTTDASPKHASAFMESYIQLVHGTKLMNFTVPSLLFGTQLSDDGLPYCNVHRYAYIQSLDIATSWNLLRGRRITPLCKTTNNTRLDQYRQTVQGGIAVMTS
ncbi:hypothetical protein DPMN_172584 [Dreissena polymorpha]|uniref:Uncharacterized protein n=1 Tax=Dreissena polymorpha TaxID=45954 RepID=A0A9D4E155_DREPO|nr:hypothetical protein DPMN_172584 [Dreissena polymorpha]